MITIKNFEILDGGSSINIHAETVLNYYITEILLWNKNNYGDYDSAISLSPFLENVNNIENLYITAGSLNLSSFEDMWFIEVFTDYESDEPCSENCQVASGVTYDLTQYYNCITQYILDLDLTSECENCPSDKNKNILSNVIIILRSLEFLITSCLYEEASRAFEKLKKLCSLVSCKNCNNLITECSSCKHFKQF